MPPTRTKKRKSTEISPVDLNSFPAPPQLIPVKTRSPVRTPTSRSPIRRGPMGITISQKQALIDNLQLEITERARKLRAQYMVQAQSLRSRVEIRINRIPIALRRANMGDLARKYGEAAQATAASQIQEKARVPERKPVAKSQSIVGSPSQGTKRRSDHFEQENENIGVAKKRVRAGQAPAPAARATSRVQSQVLSPRSANSRTLPQSPVRPASRAAAAISRPISPLKNAAPMAAGGAAGILTSMVGKAKVTRAATSRKAKTVSNSSSSSGATGRARKPVARSTASVAQVGRARTDSDMSDGSTGTTVITKALETKPATKRTVMGTLKGMGTKKAPAAKAAATGSTGTRILRKRL